MKEQEKENFLSLFENVQGSGSLLGFCVMGGIFSEGIELKKRKSYRNDYCRYGNSDDIKGKKSVAGLL